MLAMLLLGAEETFCHLANVLLISFSFRLTSCWAALFTLCKASRALLTSSLLRLCRTTSLLSSLDAALDV